MSSNNCGCNDPCQPTIPCSCQVRLNSDCITVSGSTLTCSGITDGQTLTETLNQIDTFICDKFTEISGYTTLKNVGTGAEIYKGIDGVGNKEIRTITKTGNLITVTQNTNDIAISIDEEELKTFLQGSQKTYSVANTGTGVSLYTGDTIVVDNTQFNLRTLKLSSVGSGATLVNTIDITTNPLEADFKLKTVISDTQSGTGEAVIRDIQNNPNDITLRSKKIKSDSLSVSADVENVTIENPRTHVSPDNSVIIQQVGDVFNYSVNPTWLQNWLIDNSSVICNIVSNCPVGLQANDDEVNQALAPETTYEIFVLANDSLGTAPTTITAIDTTGLSPTVATVAIEPINQESVLITMGTSFMSGVTYSFTYTITDATLATSTATVFFQDVS